MLDKPSLYILNLFLNIKQALNFYKLHIKNYKSQRCIDVHYAFFSIRQSPKLCHTIKAFQLE